MAQADTASQDALVDRFGRVHTSLRIGVTDRCNLRCRYCMPEQVEFLPRSEILTFEEIERVTRVACLLGVRKVRITGGEPLVRRNVTDLVARLARLPELEEIALTTNGLLLADHAVALKEAGLDRLNISLDSVRPEVFGQWTRRDVLPRVLEGIDAALRAGFDPIRLNALAVR
ncbi:MAG TPA: radical SAM protein, partial [Planctomycetaceae bacterium]|nr:radical SAM protein [Planctomycetaceae bacterium]